MKFLQRRVLSVAITGASYCLGPSVIADTVTDPLSGGNVGGSFNLRYEMVEDDSALEDAEALTLRSVLRFTSGTWNGFSAMLEAEDVTIVAGVDDYAVPQTGFHAGEYATIADPETTEVNQSFVQYKQNAFTARLGRQDIRFDNQRFVGAVPWRQDFQTFDALNLEYKTEKFGVNYTYVDQRNRIFAEAGDVRSKDSIVHANVATPLGMLTGFAYLLEDDISTHNALDTIGIRLTGSRTIAERNVSYVAEYATQDYERGPAQADADYFLLEAGTTIGTITAKLGYESLGSDDGMYGFATPLATVHLFQGWADQFIATPVQGINDAYLSLATPLAGGSFVVVYHDFEAGEVSAGIDDLGDELDLQWTKSFLEKYTFGLKYASYSDGDLAAKANKRIFWSWVQLNF